MNKIILIFIALFSSLESKEDYWKAEDYFQNSSSQRDAAADLMKLVPVQDRQHILDVGCGEGKITAAIAGQIPGGAVVGIDISPSMIDFAKQNFLHVPNLSFRQKDAQELDYHEEFDTVFSFTALQWVESHDAFLAGAEQSLKAGGTLAVTMPMGLPYTLEQAVNEAIATPEWSPYFKDFSTGWNFVEEAEYEKMLLAHKFHPSRVQAVPQKDLFPSRAAFEGFVSQWFPYLRPLPAELKKTFFKQVIDRFLELETPFPNGEVHFKIRRLEVIASK